MKNNRIYISGAITGTDDYIERFAAAEEKLKAAGWEVVNLAKVGEALPKLEWLEYMDIAFPLMSLCGSMFVLNNSKFSVGVALEYRFANHLEMTIYKESDGFPARESEVTKNA